MRKLGQKIKSEDKKEVKLEEVPEPSNADYEHQQSSADNKAKSSLFTKMKIILCEIEHQQKLL